MVDEEADVAEEAVFLALAQGPCPPRSPLRWALDKAFIIFLALTLTLLTLEAVRPLL
ncbi:small integral membrane protein 40 [Leptonychotes weddellii]|uniref:Small integral membrane protein 40 n=1 Tax=Leptonychotes weddellii TaxID=9713 RepID=A0A7F8R7L5_LEPWE|nr:small integral membrane protein 40 [Leptonychotes weddellii]